MDERNIGRGFAVAFAICLLLAVQCFGDVRT